MKPICRPILWILFTINLTSIIGVAMSEDKEINFHKQYYESWSSYQIPIRPSGQIQYNDTEELSSFYIGLKNSNGDLFKFTKIWKDIDPAEIVKVSEVSAVNTIIYYSSIKSLDGSFHKNKQINYSQTEGLPNYFQGILVQGSESMKLEFVRVITLFTDEYSYWDNGQLKLRIMTKENGEITRSSHDRTRL